MLTSEKVNNNFDTVTTVTNTTVLENQLRELLGQVMNEQEGGAKKKSKKSSKKAKKSSKKAKKSSKKAKKTSKKAKKTSKKASSKKSKRASKKSSNKKSKKTSRKYKNDEATNESSEPAPAPAPAPEKKKRAPNPALAAFAELSKHVSVKLGISNGPKAKKVAGAANRAIKAKFPDIGAVAVAEKAKEH
jgi:DNA mismatch repair ATPase MutL